MWICPDRPYTTPRGTIRTSYPLRRDVFKEFKKYVMHVGNVPDFTTNPIAIKEEVDSEEDDARSHRKDGSTKSLVRRFPRVAIEQRMHDPSAFHIPKALQMIAFVSPEQEPITGRKR